MSRRVFRPLPVACLLAALAILIPHESRAQSPVNWSHRSSTRGEVPVPPPSDGQSGMRVGDLDKDGKTDYLITLWKANAIVWYRPVGDTFEKYVIEPDSLGLSHGERWHDIDNDGDLDLIFGQAATGNAIYWWENPYPNYAPNTRWTRRVVRATGANMYHDFIWGDFDGDGATEFVAWNQHGGQLLLFEVPANPRTSGPWPVTTIFTWNPASIEYRGIDAADINLDGKIDLVGGGGWFEHMGGTSYTFHTIDATMNTARQFAAQFIPGGRPEIVTQQELVDGSLNLYVWNGSGWEMRVLVPRVERGHTLDIGDINGDGHLDILYGEMGMPTRTLDNPDAVTAVLYGDGTGNFVHQTVFLGQGTLEAKLGDIDNDGDLDIVGNTFRHDAPRFDLWINDGFAPVVSPGGGSFGAPVVVSLHSEAGDAIRFTTDGTVPGPASPLYTTPFAVGRTTTVRAVSVRAGTALGGTATAAFTVAADTTAPVMTTAYAVASPAQIVLRFSEPLDRATAENAASYTVDQGVSVAAATLDGSLRAVTLRTSALVAGRTYRVTVNHVTDAASPGNRIAANAQIQARAWDVPAQNLALWFRGDHGPVTNGVTVSSWHDASGNGRHAGQALAFSRPSMRATAVNGLPAVRFDGLNDHLQFVSPVNGLTGMTIFIIAANTQAQSGGGPQNERAAIFWNQLVPWGTVHLSPFQGAVNFRFGTTQTSNRTVYTRPATVGAAFTLSMAMKNGATDSLYVNGTLAVSRGGRLSTIAGNRDDGSLGRGYDDSTFYAGDIAEVIVYNRALSTTERQAVEQYLDAKYHVIGGPPPVDSGTITTSVVGSGAVSKNPNQSTYSFGQAVTLTATPGANWRFAGWSGAVSGTTNPATLTVSGDHAVTATFEPDTPPSGHPPVSDDFSSGVIDTSLWTVENPVGDGTATVSGQALRLSVPAGVDHDVWTGGNRAIRVMQPVADGNFEIEAKFESAVSRKYQMQGLLVEQDAGTYVRVNVQSDGSRTRVFAATFAAGVPTTRIDTVIPSSPHYVLRLARAGNQWTVRHSPDGAAWTTAGSFAAALAVGRTGVFAGNAQGATSPAFTAIVDYFFNTAAPIVPEDGAPQTYTIATQTVGNGSVTRSPNQPSYTLGQVVTLTATPAASWQFAGWSGAATGTSSPTTVTVTGHLAVTATFTEAVSPPGSPVSDDFSGGTLNTGLWSVENPVGAGTAVVAGNALRLSVPAGVDHNVWTAGNRAIRVMQLVADADFGIEAKFDAAVTQRYQMQGLLAEQEPGTYVRVNVHSDGSKVLVYAATFAGNVPTQRFSKAIPASTTYYLRLQRTGHTWTVRYGYDGSTWTTAGTFTAPLAVTQVGVFAGNSTGTTSPAFTSVVDYFFNTAQPVGP